MSLASNALTTTATLALDSKATEDDKIRFINLASSILENEIGRSLVKADHTKTYQCQYCDAIIIDEHPLITVGTMTYSDGTGLIVDDFTIDYNGGIIRTKEQFIDDVTITYSAGYTVSGTGKNIPADLEESCITLAKALYYNAPQFNTENTAQYPPLVQRTIDIYRGGCL